MTKVKKQYRNDGLPVELSSFKHLFSEVINVPKYQTKCFGECISTNGFITKHKIQPYPSIDDAGAVIADLISRSTPNTISNNWMQKIVFFYWEKIPDCIHLFYITRSGPEELSVSMHRTDDHLLSRDHMVAYS